MKHFIYIRDKRNNKNKFFKLESINFLFNDKNETSKKKSEAITVKNWEKSYSTWAIIFLVVAKFFLSVRRERKIKSNLIRIIKFDKVLS